MRAIGETDSLDRRGRFAFDCVRPIPRETQTRDVPDSEGAFDGKLRGNTSETEIEAIGD